MEVPASLWPTVHRLATGEDWPPRSAASAQKLSERCEWEGLLPALMDAGDLPETVREVLARNRAWASLHARRAEMLREALARVGAALAGEPFVLLKGADYAHRLYPDPRLRPMQDLDLLVPRDRADAATALLESAGFERHYPAGPVSRMPSHHERVFAIGDVTVELHHSFVQRARHRIDYESVWARRVPLALPAPVEPAARLADVDALVHHCLSMAVDEFRVALVRFLDLWLLLPAVRLEAAVERAREWQATRALYGGLRQAGRLLPEMASRESEAAMAALLPARVRGFLDRRVLPDPGLGRLEGRPARAGQLWRKAWLLDSNAARVRFALDHALAVIHGRRLARQSPD